MELDWKKTKEESYKAGYRKMLRKTFILPDGTEADYDIKDEKTACHIVALTPDNKVLLEKEFSPGVEKILLNMPAGQVDVGELPESCAKRELLEELGMEGDIELAGTSVDDSYANTVRYSFVAKNCRKTTEPKLDRDEVFEVVEMEIDEFKKLLKSGQITHAECGFIVLDYLGLLGD